MEKTLTKNDYALAGLVFVLWTMGRVILPLLSLYAPESAGPSSAFALATNLYVLLHIGVFIFTAWIVLSNRRFLFTHTKGRAHAWIRPALYGYVLFTVGVSMFFIWNGFLFYSVV